MCGMCEGEPYRGVRALFNGDFQTINEFEDRADWTILSDRVAVYVGESDLEDENHPLFRACEGAINTLTIDERTALAALSKKLKRPAYEKS